MPREKEEVIHLEQKGRYHEKEYTKKIRSQKGSKGELSFGSRKPERRRRIRNTVRVLWGKKSGNHPLLANKKKDRERRTNLHPGRA